MVNTGRTHFKIGHIPWNKGLKNFYGSKENHPMFGKHHSEKTKEKMRKPHKSFKKKKMSPEHRAKAIKNLKFGTRGKEHWNWKGGITPERKLLRNSLEYKAWRLAVFRRDFFTCQWCGYKGKIIEAAHILSFAFIPQFRFDIENGITLCKRCHKFEKEVDLFGNNYKSYIN